MFSFYNRSNSVHWGEEENNKYLTHSGMKFIIYSLVDSLCQSGDTEICMDSLSKFAMSNNIDKLFLYHKLMKLCTNWTPAETLMKNKVQNETETWTAKFIYTMKYYWKYTIDLWNVNGFRIFCFRMKFPFIFFWLCGDK